MCKSNQSPPRIRYFGNGVSKLLNSQSQMEMNKKYAETIGVFGWDFSRMRLWILPLSWRYECKVKDLCGNSMTQKKSTSILRNTRNAVWHLWKQQYFPRRRWQRLISSGERRENQPTAGRLGCYETSNPWLCIQKSQWGFGKDAIYAIYESLWFIMWFIISISSTTAICR